MKSTALVSSGGLGSTVGSQRWSNREVASHLVLCWQNSWLMAQQEVRLRAMGAGPVLAWYKCLSFAGNRMHGF